MKTFMSSPWLPHTSGTANTVTVVVTTTVLGAAVVLGFLIVALMSLYLWWRKRKIRRKPEDRVSYVRFGTNFSFGNLQCSVVDFYSYKRYAFYEEMRSQVAEYMLFKCFV